MKCHEMDFKQVEMRLASLMYDGHYATCIANQAPEYKKCKTCKDRFKCWTSKENYNTITASQIQSGTITTDRIISTGNWVDTQPRQYDTCKKKQAPKYKKCKTCKERFKCWTSTNLLSDLRLSVEELTEIQKTLSDVIRKGGISLKDLS